MMDNQCRRSDQPRRGGWPRRGGRHVRGGQPRGRGQVARDRQLMRGAQLELDGQLSRVVGPERDEVAVHQAGSRQDPNRRTGLNPDAPPFLPRHRQSPNSQRASQRELQSNSEVVQTMFQARLSHLTEKRWLSREEWGIFCSALDDLTKSVSELCSKNHQNNNNRNGQRGWRQRNARQPGRDSNRSSGRERRIREMVDIQKLYRKNPKRAMQEINKEPPPLRCQIPTQDVFAHFEQQGTSMPSFEHPDPPPFCSWQVTEDGDVMARKLTQQEVKDVLKKMPHQSAPGPDYVTYAYWKEVDPTAAIITKILETCRRNKRIPDKWKNSTTILIHKGDDPAVIKNWRPISLQNTIYKLYSALIGKRLSSWAQYNNILSPSQKGFLPCEGCLEHNFLLSSVLQDSRRRRAPVCITWLDISNAFPSVPHGVLMEMLSRTGVGPYTSEIIKDIYTGSTMCVRTGNDLTAPIPCNKGV